jgi:hypothetical protein
MVQFLVTALSFGRSVGRFVRCWVRDVHTERYEVPELSFDAHE